MTNKKILKGTYCVLAYLNSDALISIGKLGEIDFPPGYYVYVGSALNSLLARIKRHLSSDKKLYWHIDYFLGHGDVEVVDVIYAVDDARWECELAREISENSVGIDNFGCS
ncbi:MAG TPA: GIY-YIG nuclease family protein, partial [Methanobacterium sp.]|nr:GIY-YIG nuclease family protein [Methanobacterium sp.]